MARGGGGGGGGEGGGGGGGDGGGGDGGGGDGEGGGGCLCLWCLWRTVSGVIETCDVRSSIPSWF
jgi:hypothetical protein